MADYNRNRSNQSQGYNQDWDQDRERNDRDRQHDQDRYFENSQYGRDWDNYQSRSISGNQGGYNQGNENRGNRGGWNRQDYGQGYENRGDYGDMRNVSYGNVYRGNVEQREQETNRAVGGRYTHGGDYDQHRRSFGQRYGNEGYGSQSQMGNYNEDSNRRRDRDRERSSNQGREDRSWWDRTTDRVSNWFDSDSDRGNRSAEMNGPHRGKGPKGYSRSDERILEDVCDRLSDDDALDASDIEVKVQGSEVILEGRVEDREAKRRAEDLAERISGVANVQNNLKVSPIIGTRTTNAVISAVAENNNSTYANQLDQDKDRSSRRNRE